MLSNRASGVTNRRNRPGTLKPCAIAHENGQNMRKRRVFMTRSNRVSGVANGRNRPGTLKPCSPRKWPKYAKTASFEDALKSCIGGHKPSKSALNPITMCYNPREQPKYTKMASFHDVFKSYTGGHKPSKSARNPKTVCYSHENGQNIQKWRFSRRAQIVYRVSQTGEIGPEP